MDQPKHHQKGPWIADLEEGQDFIGYYLMRNLSLESFRDISRGQYLRLQLMDRSGAIEARVWEQADQIADQLEGNTIVKVDGKVESYKDQLQVRVQRIRPAQIGEYDLADLQPATQRSRSMMMNAIDEAIKKIQNPYLASLVYFFFDQENFRQAFQEAPAGVRIHHAYLGGLLEHTYEILHLAPALLELYPAIEHDLFLAGILLHDIGKLEEYQWDLEFGFTDQGRLLGHVILGSQRIAQVIASLPDFPADLAFRLQHMILAHHGRYEFGSPRRPKTLEAVALHHLEYLDAQVNRFDSLIKEAKKQGRNWTTYDHLLGRSLYVHHENMISIEESGYAD